MTPWAMSVQPSRASQLSPGHPGARYLTLEDRDHGVLNQPEALRPVLAGFLA